MTVFTKYWHFLIYICAYLVLDLSTKCGYNVDKERRVWDNSDFLWDRMLFLGDLPGRDS